MDGIPVTAVIDTGSAVTLISAPLFRAISEKGGHVVRPWTLGPILSANGTRSVPTGTTDVFVHLGPLAVQHAAIVFEGLPFHAILGVDFMAAHGVIVDVPAQSLHFAANPTASMELKVGEPHIGVFSVSRCIVPAFSEVLLHVTACLQIPPDCVAVVEPPLHACAVLVARGVCSDAVQTVLVANATPTPVTLESGAAVGRITLIPQADTVFHDSAAVSTVMAPSVTPFLPPELDLSDAQRTLTRQQLRQLHAVLSRYSDVWATETDRGAAVGVEHRVELTTDQPFAHAPRRLSPAERQLVDKMTTDMLKEGVVEPSESPWASPIVLVNKKDGSVRFCVDYRALNKITKRDVYPLPRIDDLLGALDGMRYFTSLDLKSGYWQIRMAAHDKEKTVFITPGGPTNSA